MNPYTDTTFWQFFNVLFQRLGTLLTGGPIASDELQIAVLSLVAISGALIGPFLILRKMTMLANALSHTILIGIALAFLVSPSDDLYAHLPLFMVAAVLTGLATAFITEFFTSTLRLQADASTGLTFTSLFALGILLVTLLTRNAHIGTEIVMGNVDALQISDMYWAALIAAINIVIILLFFKEYTLTTFDKALAVSLGFSPAFFSYLLMTQVSITVVSGFRAVGVLMVLALLTAPALTARLITHKLKHLILYSILIGIIGAFMGVALSRHILSVQNIALSTAGVTVCVLTFIFILAALIKVGRSKFAR
ncbi:MAG: metal ABC transporter permease [Parachlamydiales bacterium]|jgi:manganese/zinc/iron transport system permease protein